jgi:hypothetical protein
MRRRLKHAYVVLSALSQPGCYGTSSLHAVLLMSAMWTPLDFYALTHDSTGQ